MKFEHYLCTQVHVLTKFKIDRDSMDLIEWYLITGQDSAPLPVFPGMKSWYITSNQSPLVSWSREDQPTPTNERRGKQKSRSVGL